MVMIALDSVSIRLGRRMIVDDVSATLDVGLVGILGPNGAGKSTLVRAMLGLIPASGAIAIDGITLPAWPRADLARRIAYLPQGGAVHWPLTVDRLVALGRVPHLAPLGRLSDVDTVAVARAMSAADVAHLARRDATTLSGGERARALLARALAVEAPALVVDEPLAALDPAHALAVMDLLAAQAHAGVLVVAVLHDLGLAARFCDRVLVLDRGRLVADGAPGVVLTTDRLRATYGIEAWVGEAGGVSAIVPLAACL